MNELATIDRQLHYDRMALLVRANRTSVGLGYGDLRGLRHPDNRILDADKVRGLDDVTAILLQSGEGIAFLGSDPIAAEDKLFEMLLLWAWPWWMNRAPRKLQENARKAWRTRKAQLS